MINEPAGIELNAAIQQNLMLYKYACYKNLIRVSCFNLIGINCCQLRHYWHRCSGGRWPLGGALVPLWSLWSGTSWLRLRGFGVAVELSLLYCMRICGLCTPVRACARLCTPVHACTLINSWAHPQRPCLRTSHLQPYSKVWYSPYKCLIKRFGKQT